MSNEDKKGHTESMSSSVENVKSKETEIQNKDEKKIVIWKVKKKRKMGK